MCKNSFFPQVQTLLHRRTAYGMLNAQIQEGEMLAPMRHFIAAFSEIREQEKNFWNLFNKVVAIYILKYATLMES